jgi:hypothetical protein
VLHAFLTFAAEVAEHEESSKTLFYIAGGLLTAWALIVSALGVTRHDWPSSDGAARGVYAISATLVAFAMASAVITG